MLKNKTITQELQIELTNHYETTLKELEKSAE